MDKLPRAAEVSGGAGPPGPTRRQLVWLLIGVGLLSLCGVGTLVAIPIGWVFLRPSEPGNGERSPDAAVAVYLSQLDRGEDIGLRSVLAEDRRTALVDQWRSLRSEIERTDPPPSKIEHNNYKVDGDEDDREAWVSVDVRGVWSGQRESKIQATTLPWEFYLRYDSSGWRIREVTPAKWCGGHVDAAACR